MQYKTNLITRDLLELSSPTGSIYEAIAIITKRARQIAVITKEELDSKLADFVSDDTVYDQQKAECQERVETSKLYESMPKPTTIATEEFLRDELMYRYPDPEDMQEA